MHTFSLITTSLVHELLLGADVASPWKELRGLSLHDQVAAVGAVVGTGIALLVVDVELFKVCLVRGAEILVVDTPAPTERDKDSPRVRRGCSAVWTEGTGKGKPAVGLHYGGNGVGR